MNKKNSLKLCLVMVAMFAAGCASSKPTVGDTMVIQGETAQQLADTWKEGNHLIAEGEKLKKKGQNMIEEGKEKIEKAEGMLSDGKRMVETSEKTFAEKFPNVAPLK